MWLRFDGTIDEVKEGRVDIHEGAVHVVEVREDRVVVQPHDPDDREAHRVGGQGRPPVPELAGQGL